MFFVDPIPLQAAKVRYEERLKMSMKMHSHLDGVKLNREWAIFRRGQRARSGNRATAITQQCVVK